MPQGDFDYHNPEFIADPYAYLNELREQRPVWKGPSGRWYLTRYADLHQMLRDPRFKRPEMKSTSAQLSQQGYAPALLKLIDTWMLNKNAPEHTAIRGVFAQAFKPRSIQQLQPGIQATAAHMLQRIDASPGGTFELVSTFALPLPFVVITELLGIPQKDRPQLGQWMQSIAPVFNIASTPAAVAAANDVIDLALEYFRQLAETKLHDPTDDLLSRVMHEAQGNPHVTADEVLLNTAMLFGAGHETTSSLIASAVATLLRYPDQLELLRAQPELLGSAVDEVLRYESPVQTANRVASEDLTLGGKEIRKGELVIGLLGAAHRDPDQYASPDVFDITRRGAQTLAFGGGAHYCLGAALGRMEGMIAVSSFFERVDQPVQVRAARWNDNFNLRRLSALELEVLPA